MTRGRWFRLWGPVAGYLGLIFWGSSRSHVPDIGPDVSLHLLEYCGLGVLLARALCGGLRRVAGGAVLWATLAGSVYGVSDELHQSFVPGREVSVKDWCMDTVGSALGAMAARAIARRLPQRA